MMVKLFQWTLAVLIGCGGVLASQSVRAGDVSFEQVIGFSRDGRYFGFEEYGVQDGSGFPYATVYLIDLERDRWVKGSPLRVLKRSERASLRAARSEAHQLAQGLVRRLKLVIPPRLLFSRAIADPDGAKPVQPMAVPDWTDPRKPGAQSFKLNLSIFDLGQTAHCPDGVKGFSLGLDGTSATQPFYEDDSPKKSRGCVVDYRLSRVYAPDIFPAPKIGVALISVISRGFEGYDRRFIAIPVPLPQK